MVSSSIRVSLSANSSYRVTTDNVYAIIPSPQYTRPTMPQISQLQDPNDNYVVSEVAFDFGRICVKICHILFGAWIEHIKQHTSTPRLFVETLDEEFLTTTHIPYAKVITYF